jgi:MFS family permease
VRRLRSTLRAFDPGLPRAVWLLQAGGLANMFGNGLVVPFLIIYLHNVRGVSLGVAGLVAASNAAVALVSGPVAGALADRVGPRSTLTASLLIMAGAYSLFPLIEEPWHAFALNALAGAGSGAFWPSQGALLTALSPRDRRHAAFAQQRVTMNLGVGLGALVGGLIASVERPESFTVIFLLDAVTFVVFAVVLRSVPKPALGRGDADAARAGGGFAAVLRHRPFVAFIALNTLVISASIAPFSELFPVFAKGEAGVSEGGIGLIFFLNTLAVVLIQLPVARLVEGHRRMPVLALMAALFAITWLLVLVGGRWLDAGAATALFAAAFVVFALGECLHGTVQGPMVSDLAPPALLGRYMALSASSWQIAFVLGPAVGGFVLQAEPFALWPAAAALCLAAGAAALALERRLPPRVRTTPVRLPPFAVEPAPTPTPGMVSEPSG